MKRIFERLLCVAVHSIAPKGILLYVVSFASSGLCPAKDSEAVAFRTPEPVIANLSPHIQEMVQPTQSGTSSDGEALYKGAVAAIGEGDLVLAKRKLSALLQTFPEHVGALINLGWIAQREKAWTDAESYLKRANKISSDNASTWLALGVVYLEEDRIDFAMAALSQVVAIEPSNARGHRMLGIALGRKGWQSAAESELRRSLELEPNDSGAHFNLAVLYLQRQPIALEMARRHYHRAIDLGSAPDNLIESMLDSKRVAETEVSNTATE